MKYSTIFIAFFLLIGAINAVPTQHYSERTSTCARKCLNHENNLFKEIGETQTLNYETTSEIELENGQRTQVHLKAKVDIATISQCEHQMVLRKVQIDGPKEAETMKRQIERHSTKFSQDNSRIEDICFDEAEETWVLNLKKAILSTIQVTVREQTEQLIEKDVLGYCKTQYKQITPNEWQKTKFLSTCSKRSQSVNYIMTGDFDKSKKSTCKIELDSQKQTLKSVVCEETNQMLPFYQSKASGHISTKTRLHLEKTERSLPQSINKQLIRDSLTFNKKHYNKHSNEDLKEVRQAAEQLIREIRSEVEHNVQKETPEKIKKLAQHLRVLNVQELERLAQQVSNKDDKVQDIFFDTVAQTGTQETAHIILKVILDKKYYQGEVSKVRTAYWLSMLSNVDQVTDEILDIAVQHLKRDNLPRQVLFALTSMINEIKDDQEIRQDQRYQQVVEALIEKLNRQSDEKEKIAILKALRNTGVHHQVFDQILNIAKQHSRHVETRIAAVQALEQHMTEERFYRKMMNEIFENRSNEAILRIAAFQALVNNQEKVHELYNILKTESNKQVGSYVVSYFKNARESQLPEFETLRRISSTFDLPEKRFERNDLRQSKHTQLTQHIESLDMGAQVEADLVFDEQKQLRNVRARFDLNREHLQMKSVEIEVHQNGLPEVAQQMAQELVKQSNLNAIVEEVKEFTSVRSKQELNRKINKLVRLFNLNKINLNGRRIAEQMDASIHVRVQDKTVLYLNLQDIQEYAETLEKHYHQYEQIADQIVESLTGDNAFTFILSNKQHKMPTGHGLPVHSGHSMVIVAGLKVENGAFFPSFATDFHYEMGFKVMHIRPAVHYHVQLHSAPGFKVEVERKNGVPTKLAISMPEDRLEIVSARSIVKLQTANEEIELNVSKQERQDRTRLFDKIFGVELSLRSVYPRNLIEKKAMNVLFNGPFEYSLRLEKTDSSIKRWELIFETPFAQHHGQAKTLHFGFKTVGSRIDRELSAKIELQNERDSKIVNIELKTPVQSAKIEARAQMNEQNIGVKAAMIVGSQRFEAEIAAEKSHENGEQQYRPSVKLIIPGMKKIHYTGKVALVNSGKKENIKVELKDSTTNKPLIKASLIKSGRIDAQENFKLATDLQAFWFAGSSIRFVSNIDKNSKGIQTDFEAIHSAHRQSPTTYKWKLALNDLSNSENTKYNADFELNLPETSFENVAISWNFVNKANQEVETEMTGFWNNRNGQKTRQVHILQQSKLNKVSARISSLNENLLKIEIVPLSVSYELQAKTNWQRSQQKYNVQLTARDVKTNKQYHGEMSYQLPETKPLKMNLEAKIMIENNEFKIVHKIEEQKEQEYYGRTMVQLRQGEHVELDYVYRMKEHSMQLPRLNHELDAEIRVPSKQFQLKHKSTLKINSNQFEIKHSLRKNNAVVSDVKISLNKNAQSQLLIDNQMVQIRLEGDLRPSAIQKQINVSVEGKREQMSHQTKLSWSRQMKFEIDSKTLVNQKQIADISVDYLKHQKAEARIAVEQLGEITAKHLHNGQEWATIEMKSDYFSRPIRQQFSIEKQSNKKYVIKSKTQNDQQTVGELNLEIGTQSSLKVTAFDWQLSAKNSGKEFIELSLKNSRKLLSAQLSTVDESKVEYNSEHKNVELRIQLIPRSQEKYVRLTFDDKKHNIQHKSELKKQHDALHVVLEHTKNNQVVVKHNTKLSMNDESYTRTQTKKFELDATLKRNSAFEIKFNQKQNGFRHVTTVEIMDSRHQIARISSNTEKSNGEKILKIDVDFDSIKKLDVQIASDEDKEMRLRLNLKDQQKLAEFEARSKHYEINSKWSRESHKDQKYSFEIVDKKSHDKYNLFAHYQRKTQLHIKIDSSRNGKVQSGELRLHKNGEALLRIDGEQMKLRNELDFTSTPFKASAQFESKRSSIKHESVITFSQRENELVIESKTEKRSKQIANVDVRINPTTKQISASGKIYERDLKVEGNIDRRFTIELNNKDERFNHVTELDINTRTLRSETVKDNQKLNKVEIRMIRRRDIEGSIVIREHEFIMKSNENDKKIQLDYNNKKLNNLRSTGLYQINRKSISAKINAEQGSRKVVDFEANLQMDDKSFDAKLEAFQIKSEAKIELSNRNQLRASLNFDNKEQHQNVKKVHLLVDTQSSDKQTSIKIHTASMKIENEIKFAIGQELRVTGQIEHNGQRLVQINARSQLSSNKLTLEIELDSEKMTPYTLNSELKKESNQFVLYTIVKSKQQKIGQLDARIRVEGLNVDAKLEGHLDVNGRRSEVLYRLNNLNKKVEHVMKYTQANYSYGYDISFHLKQGKWIIHLPNRIVEIRYDVTSQTNGHILLNFDLLPNSQHQPNNIYNIKFDNLITMGNQELILNTKTIIHHPEIHHPIEMQFRSEFRQLTHQRPLVLFVSYDASSNQKNRISALFELMNEQHVRVVHFNISHQNEEVLDVHYRFAINSQLVHHQLVWVIANQSTQKRLTGELLSQINLKQKYAKIELNRHKLQMNWETNFDRNVILQFRAQTDNQVRKTKIMTNHQEKQIEITNFENEKMVSSYVVSVLREKNTLYAIEMHKKQGSRLQKVAFIQLVKDSLNYAKAHLKVEKSLIYEAQTAIENVQQKARSVSKRHVKEVSEIFRQQYHSMKLDEQTENTSKYLRKASQDLVDIADDYSKLITKYMSNLVETVSRVYQPISQYLRNVWNFDIEEQIHEILQEVTEQFNQIVVKWQQWQEIAENQIDRVSEQVQEWKDKLNHELVVKLSEKIERLLEDAIKRAELEGEGVYEFLRKNLRHVKMDKVVEQVRELIVRIKDEVKEMRVHENLHKLYNYQTTKLVDGKWNLRGDGEIYTKIYYPSRYFY